MKLLTILLEQSLEFDDAANRLQYELDEFIQGYNKKESDSTQHLLVEVKMIQGDNKDTGDGRVKLKQLQEQDNYLFTVPRQILEGIQHILEARKYTNVQQIPTGDIDQTGKSVFPGVKFEFDISGLT